MEISTPGGDPGNGIWRLIAAVRDVVRNNLSPSETADAVADVLDPRLSDKQLLPDSARRGNADHYQQHVLHVEPDGSFSIVALVWLPGQRTPIHDHVAWCVVGVYEGDETEIQYRITGTGDDQCLEPVSTTRNPCGSSCGFAPPGDVHEVWNSGTSKAISIHVYGADIGRLGSSVRREYRLPKRPLVESVAETT